MTIRRVAILFDDRPRPETTGIYCRRALEELVPEVVHIRPAQWGQIEAEQFDMLLRIDDGLQDPWPTSALPKAFWAIDTHIDFERTSAIAHSADWVFAAQRNGAERLRNAGISTAFWLPLACDPAIHGKQNVRKKYDVAFVGNVFNGPRKELLEELKDRYPKCFVGNAYFEAMARVYSAARTVFNRSIDSDINMRVFEGLASGSLLVTNDLTDNGLSELFQDGVHLTTYHDAGDLLERMEWYLRHARIRARIAAAGCRQTLEKHTYKHRMQELLHCVDAEISRKTVVVAEPENPKPPLTTGKTSPNRSSASFAAGGKTSVYFECARPELLQMIPLSSKRVLDVGCGAGALGASLKERQEVEVVGVEREEAVAALARRRIDSVLCCDAESADFGEEEFDCVVCGDVLEHLRRPEQFLERARGWLVPDGRLIASIPNVRHHTVVRSLLVGNWTYESAGLLDQDHLRFFTRREIEKLFYRCGFRVAERRVVPGPGYSEWVAQGHPGEVRVGGLALQGLSSNEAEEFFVYQYLIEAVPEAKPTYGRTSIIVVTHNELAYTRMCVESLLQFTDEPMDLIFVDNGSSDGTPEYLQSLGNATVLRNPDNRGFPAAVNQGLEVATGDNILLLNNDVLVTTGWLRRMLSALHENSQIGLVGPCSNQVSGSQQIAATYKDLAELDGFAWNWAASHQAEVLDIDRLVGFCLLMKREVVERIGTLDERFGIGNFEDDDYCRRAISAGFRCVIARDAFVHHFGSRTFRASGVDFGRLLRENERRYHEKWGDSPSKRTSEYAADARPSDTGASDTIQTMRTNGHVDGTPAKSYAIRVARGGGLLIERRTVRLSLCMIVRDNETTLDPCLASIRPWVDEIIVVDTGSTDSTPEIAKRHGAKVYHFPWCDDFSAARNESLNFASGEWIFWMDSDDTIDPNCGRKLRELADGDHRPSILGYVMQVHCPRPGDDGVDDITVVDHVKMFRNRPDLRFVCRIHEQILPSIRHVGGEVEFTDIFVVHSGSDHSAEGRQRKLDRDFRLLKLELRDHPDHPFALFNLGMTHADAKQFDEAVVALTRCIDRSSSAESHVRKAYALLVSSHQQARRHDEAWNACQRGRAVFSDDPELLFREAMLHHHFGRFDQAIQTYELLLELQTDRHFTSIDKGLAGYKSRHNLALVHKELGNHAAAECLWRNIVAEVPDYRCGWHGLGNALLNQQRFDEVEDIAAALTSAGSTHSTEVRCEGVLLRFRAALARNDLALARSSIKNANENYPEDLDALRELCQFSFQHATTDEAIEALSTLCERDLEDGSAPHNLGTLYLRNGKCSFAIAAYEESLRRRPDSASTLVQYGHALMASGSAPEAGEAWEQALQLDPDHDGAKFALESLSCVRK